VSNIKFAGVNLKVIMGHPEHDLLFVAKQVADAAGLKNSSQVISQFAKRGAGNSEKFLRAEDVYINYIDAAKHLVDNTGRALSPITYLMTEPQVYKLLMRGHAPQSEPFRKWVTEEVLPTIRKTGRYDIAESDTAEAKQFSSEFAMLADMMKALGDRMANLETLMQKSVQGCRVLAQVSSVGA
jgi:prophage antirepressor-like protein